MNAPQNIANIDHWQERVDLAAAFRWTVRLDMHEAVANHFSLSINDDGTKFLMNPDRVHFSRVRASDLLVVDANDPETLNRPGAPDPTAWGLHGGLHRHCPHARCAMHVHSIHATVLACLKDKRLPPLDQNAAMFFNRQAVDDQYGGLAFEDEGERCAHLLSDPKVKTLIMGNHGVMVIGDTVAETFNRLYLFERAAQIYITALQTGLPLDILSDEVAEKTAREIEEYPGGDHHHLDELKKILDAEGSDYAS
ncbi:class II aldolase and adducin N-terminal domain-containing protein [Mameliella sediminis]|uniref:class II aldolase and adducin N-terminal domain-containing protein n=1 Tax=Mameliella sediminis TaxID=2836866 RepID=UPI001C46CF6D|nr:class II aldolase and adducin N-terminal domain-containing protein [Mameliella sediminis]MBY6115013.1 class II aldolase and adducin N-terminal domain-containing protein [Antarctobacter heliothermus]MBY6145102.1 class II aldolase and adducin N-terminal domain-containing protein [Mameliella alba]MBV7396209.1 class II aldolase and adducin N-terminal domain-containing protein [Mameliella sediminis]MBY6160619.1 class II aldolase and adducin N-terminal domain-containing protein [Mameliella alba]M